MEDIPFKAVSNEELENSEEIHAGDKITCHLCGESHEVRSTDGERVNTNDMQSEALTKNKVSSFEYFKCSEKGKTVLIGIDGKMIPINK